MTNRSAMLEPAMPNDGLPRQLGRYRLLALIGQGGMGEVHRAELLLDSGEVRSCAVKLVLPHRRLDAEVVARFRREAALAGRIRHDNVVDVLDSGTDEATGTPYLVMEFIDGVTLRALAEHAWRTGASLRVEHVATLVADVARGLAAIHALVDDDGMPLSVVHRDVTPENVLVTRDGVARIGDFGIARARDDEALTQAGALRGKTPYLSPEQLDGEPATSASDVFSLGVMLSFLLTGRRPFDRATELATMNAIVDEEFPTMSHDRPELPPALSSLVRAMVEKVPAQRLSAAEVARELERIAASLPRGAERPVELVESMLGPRDPLAATPLSTRVLSLPPTAVQRLQQVAAETNVVAASWPAAPPPAPPPGRMVIGRRSVFVFVFVVVVLVVSAAVIVATGHALPRP
jgi:serine/threonine protein kinase